MSVFVVVKPADNTILLISVSAACVAACTMVTVIALLIYCYKLKNRYRKLGLYEFRKDYDTMSRLCNPIS